MNATMSTSTGQAKTVTMSVSPGTVSVGWIGTGVMGCAMALHLLRAGYTRMTVYNRTAHKTQALIEAGAELGESPAAVARASEIVFVMVGTPDDVREVVSSPIGVLSSLREGGIVVDHTTSHPALAAEVAALGAARGQTVIDAPVTGGDVGARNGTLSILAGGHAGTIELIRPLLECYSSKISILGGPGCGQHCKMGNQINVAATLVGMCEGLMYAHSAGLDLESYIEAIVDGAAGSFTMKAYAARIVKGDMAAGFYIEHLVKDLGIAINSCAQMNVALPGLGLAQQLYVSMMAHGEGRLGVQALTHALERMNGKKLPIKESA